MDKQAISVAGLRMSVRVPVVKFTERHKICQTVVPLRIRATTLALEHPVMYHGCLLLADYAQPAVPVIHQLLTGNPLSLVHVSP